MAESVVSITGLRTYPVKSMAGNAIDSARVLPWGLAGDRRWALVDDTGKDLTARKAHTLLGLHAEHAGDSGIRITDRNGEEIVVQAPVGVPTIPVLFTGLDHATPAGPAADEWISSRIGRELRLVWQSDPTLRPVAEKHGGLPGETLSLADDGPLLLVSASSMRQLNEWVAADADVPDVAGLNPKDLSDDRGVGNGLADGTNQDGPAPLDIVRFRPNVIVDGDLPFAEDHWARIWLGGVEFHRTMLCDRCVMTTIEPTTLAGGKEPIRTLARHRRWDNKTWFGIRIAPVGVDASNPPTITIGDAVKVELD